MVQKKKVFITGAAGFIGHNAVEQLSPAYEVLSPSQSELELLDSEAVKAYLHSQKPDVVVHMANVGGKRGQVVPDLVGQNLRMFFNVANCSGDFGRLIQMGSGAEYDKTDLPPKVKEEHFGLHVPSNDYGFYKYVCAQHVAHMPDAVGLRIFGCYGPHEDWHVRFISDNLLRAMKRQPMSIDNQNVTFDYLHVSDLASILAHFIEHKPSHRFYNATPDVSVDLLTIAKTINQVTGQDLPIHIGKSGMAPEYSGNNARLRQEMPDLSFTPLEMGIRKLYEWYQQHPPQQP